MVAALGSCGSEAFAMGSFCWGITQAIDMGWTSALAKHISPGLLASPSYLRAPQKRIVNRAASGGFTGKRDDLKGSSSYTRAFGVCIVVCMKQFSSDRVHDIMQERGI